MWGSRRADLFKLRCNRRLVPVRSTIAASPIPEPIPCNPVEYAMPYEASVWPEKLVNATAVSEVGLTILPVVIKFLS